MRNLTICLIAFAVAFAMCGLAFRSVVAAQGKLRQDTASASYAPGKPAPGPGGVPAFRDGELY
jgi:hypothetical protein